jgi:hypothetical protein
VRWDADFVLFAFSVIEITDAFGSTNDIRTSHSEHNMPSNRARIVIADDHNLVAELCKTLLEPEFDVIGTVSDGHALLRAANRAKARRGHSRHRYAVLNGLDAGKQMKEAMHAVKLIYLFR